MSDNKNDSNDPNDDEKKEESSKIAEPQTSGNHQPLKSRYFLQNSELIFGYLNKIYKRYPKEFMSDKSAYYSLFFSSLHFKKTLQEPVVTNIEILKCIGYIFLKSGNNVAKDAVDNKDKKQTVSGLLYVAIQSTGDPIKYTTSWALQKAVQETEKHPDLKAVNISFAITSPRSLEAYEKISEASRIIINLDMSPQDFWNSKIAYKLIEKLQHFPFATELKVRDAYGFRQADSLIIYLSCDYEEAWKQIGKVVADIVPENTRGNYSLPFSAPLAKGIIANILIDYYPGLAKLAKTTSFTDGLAQLGREAYIKLLNMDTSDLDDKLSIFQGILASIINKNKLVVTEDGVLRQPERLKKA